MIPTEPNAGEVEVWFPLPVDASGDRLWEAINADSIQEDIVELRGVPAFAYGLGYGDRVEVLRASEGPLVAARVAAPSAFATFRVWLGTTIDSQLGWRVVAEQFARLGCLVDVYSEQLIALAAHRDQVAAVRDALEELSLRSGTEWEDGRPVDRT